MQQQKTASVSNGREVTIESLETCLDRFRLSDELLRIMEEEGISLSEFEKRANAPAGYAARAIDGDLPIESLREAVRLITIS